MHRRERRALISGISTGLVLMLAFACKAPLLGTGSGMVQVDFGQGAARTLPLAVQTIELAVQADDMDPLSFELDAPDYAVSFEVAAGKDRLFSVLAKDAGEVVRYTGASTIDIEAGQTVDLDISMEAVYYILYNANGATAGSSPVDRSWYKAEARVQVAGNSGGLDLAGRIFAGWNLAADGSGTSYAVGADLVMPAQDLTLYAQWAYPHYAITYHLNGGISHSNPSSYSEPDLPLALAPAEWGANSFIGWYSDPGLLTPVTSILAGTSGPLDLYAKWNLPTVSFNANGGTGTMAAQQAPAGTATALAGNVFMRTGYQFTQWNNQADGLGSTILSDGETWTWPAADLTLYAQWAANTYVVTYDAQGGTPSGTTSNVVFDSAYGTAPGVSRPGYTFERWNTASDGTGTDINGGSILAIAADHTLYAIWTPNVYMVTFDAQGGSAPIPATMNVTFGLPYGSLAATTMFGNNFGGWWEGPGATGTQVFAGNLMLTAAAHSLYAFWSPATYAVVFDGNGADVGGMAHQMIEFGNNTPLTANAFSRTGHTFSSWNSASDGSGTSYLDSDMFIMNMEGITLYAQWMINTYELSYDANGGTGTVPTMVPIVYNQPFVAAAPAAELLGPVVIAGTGITQRFLGWNTASDGSGTNYAVGGSGPMPAMNLVLYARWTTDGSALGKRGPAGGWVFHDKGSVTDGWRFLEAAPKLYEQASVQWQSTTNTSTIAGASGTAIGYGDYNTILASRYFTATGYTGAATASDSLSYSFNMQTYDDWFMPAKDELADMYTNLKVPGLGEFEAQNYWASSEATHPAPGAGMYAWYQAFFSVTQNENFAKTNSANIYVRPARAFADPDPTYTVVYYANGADSGNAPVVLARYKAGTAIVLAGDNGMIKSLLPPTGWNTQADGLGTNYSIGQSGVIMPAGDLILYAIW